MFFAFDGNDDKYQTIIHRISMRCRLFMMLANVAQHPFCYNMKKSPHAMYSDIPIGIRRKILSTYFNRLITFAHSITCLISNSL